MWDHQQKNRAFAQITEGWIRETVQELV